MLRVRLSANTPPGHTHDERLSAARRICREALDRHGASIQAVGIYGSTAIDIDGPYSDLDMTFITRVEMGQESTVTTRDGLLVNLDYQTWEESVIEAQNPELAGTWADFFVLYDPESRFPALRAIADSLTREDYFRAFRAKVTDEVATALGKLRNAVAAEDRASFLGACQDYSEVVCLAVCLFSQRYVTGRARLRETTKQMPGLPEDFALLIDQVSGAQLATDQEAYDAAERLWIGISSRRLVAEIHRPFVPPQHDHE